MFIIIVIIVIIIFNKTKCLFKLTCWCSMFLIYKANENDPKKAKTKRVTKMSLKIQSFVRHKKSSSCHFFLITEGKIFLPPPPTLRGNLNLVLLAEVKFL